MLATRTVDTGRLRISYDESSPDGPPLLLLHGAGSNRHNWLPLLPPLSLCSRVLAADLRGHGASSRSDAYRLDDYVEDMVALLHAVAGEPAVVVGYALGGYIALQLAAQHPELARGLAIVDTSLFATDEPTDGIFHAALATIAAEYTTVFDATLALSDLAVGEAHGKTLRMLDLLDGPVLRAWAAALLQTHPEALRILAEGDTLAGFDATALLPQVQCPGLLIQGDPARGANMSDVDARRALALLQDGTHIRLNFLGHGLHQEDADTVSRPLTYWLSSL